MNEKIKMLIDVDTGVDDSIALLYALFHPQVEVVGITTGCGNTSAAQAAENTLKMMELAGVKENIPVIIGAKQPLEEEWDGPVAFIHGDNGIGNVELPKPTGKITEGITAEDFLYDMACRYERELVLVTLGRLTNIAHCLRKYPDLPGKIKKMVMMGGTVFAPGNVTPVSEANFWGDPRACDLVFQAGFEATVVGLDVTMKTRLTMADVEIMKKYASERCKKAADYIQKALEHYMTGNRIQNYCLDDCPLHDPLAMVAAVVPSVITTREMKARIECQGSYSRGMVVTDLREHPFDAQYIRFAVEVDSKRALRELMSVFWEEQKG